MRIRVRSLLLCMTCCTVPASAQTYPAKPVRLKQRLTDLGVDVEPQNSAEFSAFFRAETARWIKTAKETGIVPQ